MIKKIFSKVFKKFKKILRPIGRELKKGLKGVGKFFGKLGPVGTLALGLMIPGIGSALSSFGAWAGVGAGATAPFSGTIFGPLGKVIQGVAKVGEGVGKVYNSVSGFVGGVVDKITFGQSTKFSNWVSNKLDKTRQMFGLETSMKESEFSKALETNAEQLENISSVSDKATNLDIGYKEAVTKQGRTFNVETDKLEDIVGRESLLREPTLSEKLKGGFGDTKNMLNEDLSINTEALNLGDGKIKEQTLAELYPDRKTIEVPVGYEKIDSEVLGEFNKIKIGGKKGYTTTSPEGVTVEVPAVEARNQFDFKKYDVKTKTVFEDQLTPEQLDAINVDDTKYFADFENDRLSKAEKYYEGLSKSEQADLLKNPKGLERAVVGQDVAALGKPAAVVGSILSPDEPEPTGSGGGYVAPLPTDTDVKNYTDSVAGTYAALGYKGDNSLQGYAMFGGYGNTPFNFMQQYSRPVPQPIITTPMPSIG